MLAFNVATPLSSSNTNTSIMTHLSQKQRNLLCKVYTLRLLFDCLDPYCMIKLQLIIWIYLWDHLDQYLVQNYEHISSRWKETLESLRATTQRQQRCHKCCMFHEAKQSFARPSRAFFISVHFFHVLGKSATWNGHFSSFAENVNTRPPIWIFFPGFYTTPLNSVPG